MTNLESLESRFSSIVPRVEFLDVQDQYSQKEDLICKYSLIDYEVQEGDRIAIFKLGWQYVKDYVLFEWVPRFPEENLVVFNKLCLPKNTKEIYQFCFISGENNVHGASEPFQFYDKPKIGHSMMSSFKKDMHLSTDNYKSLISNSGIVSLGSIDIPDKDKEILKLKEENDFLHNTLKIIVTNQKPKNSDAEMQSLKKMIHDLQSAVRIQQLQIKELHLKVTDCTESYKKLKKENIDLQSICQNLKGKLENQVNYSKVADVDLIGELESIPPFPFAK